MLLECANGFFFIPRMIFSIFFPISIAVHDGKATQKSWVLFRKKKKGLLREQIEHQNTYISICENRERFCN